MRKLITGFFIFSILLITLTACSGNSSKDSQKSKKKFKIGIVQAMDHPSINNIRETIIAELESSNMKDKIEITFKNAEGDPKKVPKIMQSLITEQMDLVVSIGTYTTQAAVSAIKDIDIVFAAVSNPIEAGLVPSFDKVDGNITGVSNSIAIEEILDLAMELTPEVKTFGFLYNRSEVNSSTGIARAKKYCDENGIKYKEATVEDKSDIEKAASSLVNKVDAFFTPNDNTVASDMSTYTKVAKEANKPIYVGADSMVKEGGLASVSIDYTELAKKTAKMILRIVGGEKISDNPVEQISDYSIVLNKKVATELGITVSEERMKDFVIVGE